MANRNFDIPGQNEDREACLQMALDAAVNSTYIVTASPSDPYSTEHFSRSFSTALELWRYGGDRRFCVVFNWSYGDESGSGIARYHRETSENVEPGIIERAIRAMIVGEIAECLFKRVPQLDDVHQLTLAA